MSVVFRGEIDVTSLEPQQRWIQVMKASCGTPRPSTRTHRCKRRKARGRLRLREVPRGNDSSFRKVRHRAAAAGLAACDIPYIGTAATLISSFAGNMRDWLFAPKAAGEFCSTNRPSGPVLCSVLCRTNCRL